MKATTLNVASIIEVQKKRSKGVKEAEAIVGYR